MAGALRYTSAKAAIPANLDMLKYSNKKSDSVAVGANSVGRWHAPDSTLGWHLSEASDLTLVAQHVAEWSDLLVIEIYPVIEDAEAGAAAKIAFGKLSIRREAGRLPTFLPFSFVWPVALASRVRYALLPRYGLTRVVNLGCLKGLFSRRQSRQYVAANVVILLLSGYNTPSAISFASAARVVYQMEFWRDTSIFGMSVLCTPG